MELKSLWEAKLKASKTVEPPALPQPSQMPSPKATPPVVK